MHTPLRLLAAICLPSLNRSADEGMTIPEAEEPLVVGHQPSPSSTQSPSRAKVSTSMDPSMWHKVAAISGMAALGLGTYGSHVFKPQDAYYKQVWKTASLYHLVHTAALVGAPITKHSNVFGGLLTAGILAFSGTCYTVAYLEDRKYSLPAPFGGFAFIAAWASLLF